MSLHLTAVSAYLIVPSLVGKSSASLQAFIFTVLFVFVAPLNTVAVMAYFESAVYFDPTCGPGRTPDYTVMAVAPVFFGGILISLKFIPDVRHP